jgi:hypothetical protein
LHGQINTLESHHHAVVEDGVRLQQPELDGVPHVQVATLSIIEPLHIHQPVVLGIVDHSILVEVSSLHNQRNLVALRSERCGI